MALTPLIRVVERYSGNLIESDERPNYDISPLDIYIPDYLGILSHPSSIASAWQSQTQQDSQMSAVFKVGFQTHEKL